MWFISFKGWNRGAIFCSQLPGIHDIKLACWGTVMSITAGLKGSQTLRDRVAPVHGVIIVWVGILWIICVCVSLRVFGETWRAIGEEWIIDEFLYNTPTPKHTHTHLIASQPKEESWIISLTKWTSTLPQNLIVIWHIFTPGGLKKLADWDHISQNWLQAAWTAFGS